MPNFWGVLHGFQHFLSLWLLWATFTRVIEQGRVGMGRHSRGIPPTIGTSKNITPVPLAPKEKFDLRMGVRKGLGGGGRRPPHHDGVGGGWPPTHHRQGSGGSHTALGREKWGGGKTGIQKLRRTCGNRLPLGKTCTSFVPAQTLPGCSAAAWRRSRPAPSHPTAPCPGPRGSESAPGARRPSRAGCTSAGFLPHGRHCCPQPQRKTRAHTRRPHAGRHVWKEAGWHARTHAETLLIWCNVYKYVCTVHSKTFHISQEGWAVFQKIR